MSVWGNNPKALAESGDSAWWRRSSKLSLSEVSPVLLLSSLYDADMGKSELGIWALQVETIKIQNGFWKLICFLFICHMKSSSRFLKFLNHSLSNYILRTFGVLLLMICNLPYLMYGICIYVYNHTYMVKSVFPIKHLLYVSRGETRPMCFAKLLKLFHLFY